MMSRDNTFIMVCVHKPDAFLAQPPYRPIHVGKAISSVEIPGTIGDDTGDNISTRNLDYNELTAQYWAWKNLPEKIEYVGLNHYRRYFDYTQKRRAAPYTIVGARDFFAQEHPTPDFKKLFERYDVVMCKPLIYHCNIWATCLWWWKPDVMLMLRRVVAEKYPDYLIDFDHQFLYNNGASLFNMMIMPRRAFDSYSQWLFDILFELERRVEFERSRMPGMLSERLLDVWVRHNHLRKCCHPFHFVGDGVPRKMELLRRLRKNIVFGLTQPARLRRQKRIIRQFEQQCSPPTSK